MMHAEDLFKQDTVPVSGAPITQFRATLEPTAGLWLEQPASLSAGQKIRPGRWLAGAYPPARLLEPELRSVAGGPMPSCSFAFTARPSQSTPGWRFSARQRPSAGPGQEDELKAGEEEEAPNEGESSCCRLSSVPAAARVGHLCCCLAWPGLHTYMSKQSQQQRPGSDASSPTRA